MKQGVQGSVRIEWSLERFAPSYTPWTPGTSVMRTQNSWHFNEKNSFFGLK